MRVGLAATVACLAVATVQGVATGAQQARGTLMGTVNDPLGAPVEGMLVSIESGPFGSGVADETQTDKDGQYRFDELPPGVYTILVPIEFVPAIEVSLDAGQVLRRDIRIHIEEVIGTYSVCVDCAEAPRYTPPDSLVKEFASDRDAAQKQSVTVAEPAVGWESYEPDVRLTDTIRERGLTGAVVLEARVEADGAVKNVTVVSSPHPELSAAAVAALQRERWNAATVRGVPVAAPLRLTIEFVRRVTPK